MKMTLTQRWRMKPINKDRMIVSGLLLLFSYPFFYYKIISHYPSQPAGLYALMAETISAAHFSLPYTVPFYGPGGIPFAYPPLALYVMAFFGSFLHVSSLDYLRFAPSVFLWFCLIPVYWLGKAFSGSSRQAAIAVCLFGTSFGILSNQYVPPGAVRSLALLFLLLTIFFAYRAFFQPRILFFILTAVFFALTILSHLSYAVFGAVSIGTFALLPGRKKLWQRLLVAAAIGAGGLLLASPWWITVCVRHGYTVFVDALNTHDNTRVLILFSDLPRNIALILNSLFFYRFESPLLIGAAIIGLGVCLATKKYLLPAWLLITALVVGGDGQRFVAIVFAFLAAQAIETFLLDPPYIHWKDLKAGVRTLILYLASALMIFLSTHLAYIFRVGDVRDYSSLISVTILVGLSTKLPSIVFFHALPKDGEAPNLNKGLFRNIILASTVGTGFLFVICLGLVGMKLIPLRVPYTVFILDWVLTTLSLFGINWLVQAIGVNNGSFLPSAIFLAVFGFAFYLNQPTLYSIDSKSLDVFFTSAEQMSAWIQTHIPQNATYLALSEPANEDVPGILSGTTEWFPYLLKRSPAVLPFGAEWTNQYGRQVQLSNELSECENRQSLVCLETFMAKEQVHPNLLIVPRSEEPDSLYNALVSSNNWVLSYQNQEYSIWESSPTQ